MQEILKALYNVRSLSLGWSIWWRSVLVILAHMVIIFILTLIIQNLGQTVMGIFNLLVAIAMMIISFMSLGWAAQRIKGKL
jgi:hypothetical protein